MAHCNCNALLIATHMTNLNKYTNESANPIASALLLEACYKMSDLAYLVFA